MSSAKWQTINGFRYPVEDSGWETPDKESFTYDGKVWDVVRELTVEEAMAIAGKPKKDWVEATEDELLEGAFGEGVPGWVFHPALEPRQLFPTGTTIVKMGEEKTQMPFGLANTAPLLELLWRKTGADCSGEEEDLELPFGVYKILLQD